MKRSLSLGQQDWLKALGLVAFVVVCGGAIAALQLLHLRQLKTSSATLPIAEIRRDLRTEKGWLNLLEKIPSFGYDNLVADWVFLNFLQYFGDTSIRERTDYTLSPEYFDVILKRNPYFLNAYIFLSTSTSLYAGMPERATEIMSTGLESISPEIPGTYYIWRAKAIDELLFVGDAAAAQQSFETAADWAAQSSDPESQAVAASSRQTAQFLATNPNSKTAQVAAWTMVLGNAPDDRTRQTAIDRIRALGGDIVQNPDGNFSIKAPRED
jgi:hypothetical protein